jgi:thymidylate synthase (FAD)
MLLARDNNWKDTMPRISKAAEEIIDLYFPVHDYGFVALKDVMGSDESIEAAARVSYGAGTRATSDTRNLIRYLVRNRHNSPLEMCEMQFHISMPIFVARQWIRHRTSSLNELSGRYSVMPMAFYTPEREQFTIQAEDNKQGRSTAAMEEQTHFFIEASRADLRDQMAEHYQNQLDENVARELARIDLPLSMYTQMYFKMDLHNLLHFLSLRLDPHAQYEIRAYAEVIAGMVQRVAPLAYEAWLDYRLCGSSLGLAEMRVLRTLLAADDEGVSASGGISNEVLRVTLGMSAREITDLKTKLKKQDRPDYSLDLSKAKTGDYYAQQMNELA